MHMVEQVGKKSSSGLPQLAKCGLGREVLGTQKLPTTENMRVNTKQGAGAGKDDHTTHTSVLNYTQKHSFQLSKSTDKRLQKGSGEFQKKILKNIE